VSNRLELPDDLASLIEKREGNDRRKEQQPLPVAKDRRSGVDRRDHDPPTLPSEDTPAQAR
jgi:hypothetical protein